MKKYINQSAPEHTMTYPFCILVFSYSYSRQYSVKTKASGKLTLDSDYFSIYVFKDWIIYLSKRQRERKKE